MTDNTTELDFGTTAQKATDAEKLPVVLLALDQGRYDMARSLDELRALADANGMDAVAEVVQKRATPEAATLLGEGKVAEARLVCQNVNAAAAIFDCELTGSQIRNLSPRRTSASCRPSLPRFAINCRVCRDWAKP